MGLLEEINQMRNQGMEEKEISDNLKERGITPGAINDAFNQMKIKNAISADNTQEGKQEYSQVFQRPNSNLYVPKTQEIEDLSEPPIYSGQQEQPMEIPQPPGNYNEYYPQEGYEEYASGGEGGYDTNTLIEIAEQVFSEKVKKIQKQIESLNEFANLAETKITNNHERIKRIEAIMDKLQISILDKISSYGKNIEGIKNEMEMMQDSFGKMIPELHEKHKESPKNKTPKKKILKK